MKKYFTISLTLIFTVFCGLLTFNKLTHKPAPETQRDFIIYHSFIHQGGDYKDTMLKVIVNVEDYDMPEMFERVKEFHDKMNGESNKLTIELYDGKENFENYNMSGTKTYYNDKILETKHYYLPEDDLFQK